MLDVALVKVLDVQGHGGSRIIQHFVEMMGGEEIDVAPILADSDEVR